VTIITGAQLPLRRPIVLATTRGIAAERKCRINVVAALHLYGNAEMTLTLVTSHAPAALTCRIVGSFFGVYCC